MTIKMIKIPATVNQVRKYGMIGRCVLNPIVDTFGNVLISKEEFNAVEFQTIINDLKQKYTLIEIDYEVPSNPNP